MSGEICAYCYEPITEICWCNPDNQLTQAQARIKELEGLVREMRKIILAPLPDGFKPINWISEVRITIRTISNRPEVQTIMEEKP